jgi:hypothetical protein
VKRHATAAHDDNDGDDLPAHYAPAWYDDNEGAIFDPEQPHLRKHHNRSATILPDVSAIRSEERRRH